MSNYGFTSAGTSYDDEDRLTGFARASGTFTQSWSLTSVGDWNSITTNGTAQNRTHGPTHELLTAGGQNVTTDVKGNITLLPTTLTTSGVAMAVGYDFDNKLKSADVDNNGSNDVTFQYDALGRRVARQGTSGSFVYVQQDQQTIADYGYGDAPSSPTHRYVVASYIDEPVVRKAAGTSGTIHYYHRNQQYSITAVTTSSGSVAERYAYTAYGQPTILDGSGSVLSSSAINNRYTYTGREWDATLGLYHFRARWMSGLAGRFMARDPIGYLGRSLGLYQYVRSRTTRYLDPEGTQDGDAPVVQPFIQIPGSTNCIGFCLHPEIDYIAPRTTIQAMLDHFKQKCDKSSGSASDCLNKCQQNLKQGGSGCNQLLIYIKDYGDEVNARIQALLEQLLSAQNQQDYEFLLNAIWATLNDRLGQKGGLGDDPLDIHMNRCDVLCKDEFIYQSGACKKDNPKRRVCNFFKPTPEKPEMIDPRRIVFKSCCCK